MPFKRVLVANRGEVAVRVIRALHELGIEAVAVYSTADRGALHTRLADRAVCVGPPAVAESYLNIPSLVGAAETTGCDAVHPGWGFLAESSAFVRACVDNDLVFVGPSAETMERAGDKALAKEELARVGVPLVPGPEGRTTPAEARAAAHDLGYPVLLKAAAGGGGKGMRLVSGPDELEPAFDRAAAEAQAAFGDGTLYLDPDGSFYFIELNARLQVEHPVSELVTGIDIVRAQLAIAAGEPLPTTGRAPRRGHAIEVRINAEDPANGFRPAPGVIERFRPPLGPGVRIDTHVEEGAVIPPHYDSLVAKLIVWDADRPAAIERTLRALDELDLRGVATTRDVARDIVSSVEFRSGDYHTGFLAEAEGRLPALAAR